MKIQMLHTAKGSSDGFKVERFIEGQTYDTHTDIGGSLARQFIQRRQAIVTQSQSINEVMAELTGRAA